MDFYDIVCLKNNHVEKEELEVIFDQIKQFLYEQFQEEIEDLEGI